MVWSFKYNCRIVVASVYTIRNYLVMLRLIRIIAIVVVLIILILNNRTIVRSESPPYCGQSSKTSRCPGDHDHVKIVYPFWIEKGTADETGDCIISYYPGFQVNCAANGRPVINISNNLYYVLSTYRERDEYGGLLYEYGGVGRLRVVDVDIDAQECPQPRRNISIEESTQFLPHIYGADNMTFLYNCSKYPENVVQHVPCLYNSSRGPSFALFDYEISTHEFDWYGNCEDAVLVSDWILNDPFSDTEDYTAALKSGFELYWDYPVNCGNCELSGGKCWADWADEINQPTITTTPFYCNCTDGTALGDRICPGPYHDSFYGTDYFNRRARKEDLLSSWNVGCSVVTIEKLSYQSVFVLACVFREGISTLFRHRC